MGLLNGLVGGLSRTSLGRSVLNYANRTSQPVQVYDNARATQTATQYPATDIPAQLFANGEQGLWLDPSDFSTMFQNIAGTTPVTAVEQAVGRMLDKSGNDNHVSASADARRPILRARYNILTQTEAFDTTVWIKTNSTVVGAQPNAPNGTATATLFASNAANAGHFMFRSSLTNFIPITAGVRYTYAVHMKKGSGATAPDIMQLAFAQTQFETGNYANFNISAGQVLMTSGVSASISDAGSGWFLCAITATAIGSTTASGAGGIGFTDNNDSLGRLPSYADAATSDVFIWGADLRVANDGVNLPNYQRVGAFTDYDTIGFPPYLAFDGVDDCLLTSSTVNFTGTNEIMLYFGLRKLSSVQGMIVELTASLLNNTGTFYFLSASNNYQLANRGTIIGALTTSPIYLFPITNSLLALASIQRNQLKMSANGLENSQAFPEFGGGNYRNSTVFIGARNNNTFRFNGRIYGLIVRGAYTAPRLIEQAEMYMNSKTQAY
jgi:hypothetical protein